MPEQLLRAAQVVMGFARHGVLQLVLLWRKWRHPVSRVRLTRSGPGRRNRIRRGVFLEYRVGRLERCGGSPAHRSEVTPLGVAGSIGRGAGSLRSDDATAGCGHTLATSCSTCRLLLCRAALSSPAWFSWVRTGPSSVTLVSVRSPLASATRIAGKRRAARAASMRPYAACSEKWSTCVQ